MAAQARKRKRRLGKGLKSLLMKPVEVEPTISTSHRNEDPEVNPTQNAAPHMAGSATPSNSIDGSQQGLDYLPTDLVVPNPNQPRQVFDEQGLLALAQSIKTAGLMQPVVVRQKAGTEVYELVAGERRWRAAKLAGLDRIPALVRDLDDKAAAEWSLIENLQREDLNPMDRAEALERLLVDFNLTQKEIANQLGIDRSSVANFIRLNDLEPTIKDFVRDGSLSMGHAKVLLGLPDASTSKALAKRCAFAQWSVRELERRIRKGTQKHAHGTMEDPNPLIMHMEHLSTQLGEHLGTKVRVTAGRKKGSGSLTILFYTNDQFEGILSRLDFTPSS